MDTINKMEPVLLVPLDVAYVIVQLVMYVLKDIMDKDNNNHALIVLLAAVVVHHQIYAINVNQDSILPSHKHLHHHFHYVTLVFNLVLFAPVILLALHVH